MAKTAVPTTQVVVSGDAMGSSSFGQTNAANTNCPPPTFAALSAGNNTVTVPSGFTVNQATIFPPPASTNTKVYKGVSGDTGFTGTFQAVQVPVAAGGTFVINSVGSETVQIVYS